MHKGHFMAALWGAVFTSLFLLALGFIPGNPIRKYITGA
jgi:hypothetical protein